MRRASSARSRSRKSGVMLEAPGWNDQTRIALERLICAGSGKRLPAVFDFDNTIVSGDIGEAAMAILARDGLLKAARLPKTLCPPFHVPGKGKVRLENCADITEYYSALLAPTAHRLKDRTPMANGYVWATEILEGLRPLDVVQATQTAFELSRPGQPTFIEVTPGQTAFPAPFFYPEMVELIGELLRHEFEVWIVSASNVWSVRWMALQALNPLLRKHGFRRGLQADHVIGISTLLTDRQGCLYKDSLLVREDLDYAALEERALGRFRLTSRLQFPAPTYSGKVAAIFDAIGQIPHLCAGDSPGDHAMMTIAQHRLWIARLDKPGYQRSALEFVRKTDGQGWLVQPTIANQSPGFVSRIQDLPRRLGTVPAVVKESLGILARFGIKS